MCATLGVQSGVRVTFSVFFVAWREAFGWSAAATAGVMSLYMLVLACSSPLMGWLLDRYGARRLFPAAALLAGASLWLCSMVQTLWQLYVVYGLVFALGQTALSTGTVSVVLARWFPEMRGRAIALADLGAGLGMGLYSPWSQWLITTYGWRQALCWLAASMVLLLVPLNACQRPAPQHEALPQPPGADAAPLPASTWTLKQALFTWPFWMLFGTQLLSSISLQVINVHLVALLVSMGVVAMLAATAGGMVNLVSLGGRFACGWLADRFSRALAYTAAMGCSMLGMAILLGLTPSNAAWVTIAFIAVFGISKGSGGIVIGAKAADIFQGERLGTIYGAISMASGFGGAFGPLWAGWLVDHTGSYTIALLCSIVTAGMAVGCFWLVGGLRLKHR